VSALWRGSGGGAPGELVLSERDALERSSAPPGGAWAGVGFAAVLLFFYLIAGPTGSGGRLVAAGSADAGAILRGSPWRAVTALTLHTDSTHLVANMVAGGLLVGAAGWTFGGGLASLLVVVTGAMGNAANAALRGPPHVAVGASTAVLGAVGVLAGSAAVRAHRAEGAARRWGWWVPIAAGFGLLAVLGADTRSDLGAHLCGFVAGVGFGALVAGVCPEPPTTRIQRTLAVVALLALGAAWGLALAS